MQNENIVTLQVRMTRTRALMALALLFLCWRPGPLGSETLTLTTYYPAPYGGYVSILTTGNTFLARDTGNVAVGNVTATSKLHVQGTGNVAVDLRVNGRIMTGDGGGNGGVWLGSDTSGFVGSAGNTMGFWTNGAGWNALSINKGNGFVGMGNTNPQARLHVSGDVQIDNNGWLRGLCVEVGFGGGNSSCPGGRRVMGQYGTGRCYSGLLFLGGTLESGGSWVPHYEQGCSGTMLCCYVRNF